jgi:NADPH2:quinone reductase
MDAMKAITIPEFGAPDVLRLDEVKTPEPGPGQVSIDVSHAGVNYAEILYRQGFVNVPLPFVPGIEVSGRIRALGPGVEGLRPGQPVAALTIVNGGGYAEVAVTSAALVAPLDDLPLEPHIAAALPSNSTTAFLVLDRVARLAPGETVLIHAAAGGVGSQLGQAARLLGASRVVGTVGTPAKIQAAKNFGYDEVILRDKAPNTEHFDVVVDPVGGPSRHLSLNLLAPMGRMIAMGNASAAPDVTISTNTLWLTNKTISGFNLAAFSATHPETVGRALRQAITAAARGDLHVQVETLPLEAAAQAHHRLQSATTTGKLVLAIRP